MTDPTRPLTLADLWLPGEALNGAMLNGWIGPCTRKGPLDCMTVLDFTRPEVRDRAVRVLGPDLLPIHAAELRGDITPGEAAGLVWCSVVRREAGLGVVALPLSVEPDECDPGSLLAAGYSPREPGGILLLPLPDGVIWRLDTSR